MEVSIAVAVADEVEVGRKKRGDIIAIKPAGWQWGSGEVKNHLILEVVIPEGKTIDDASKLQAVYYAGGVLSWEGDQPAIEAKRRFKIDWALLQSVVQKAGIEVDWKQVEDKTVAYQPLSPQEAAPDKGQKASLDMTKITYDKYEEKLVDAVSFSNMVIG